MEISKYFFPKKFITFKYKRWGLGGRGGGGGGRISTGKLTKKKTWQKIMESRFVNFDLGSSTV